MFLVSFFFSGLYEATKEKAGYSRLFDVECGLIPLLEAKRFIQLKDFPGQLGLELEAMFRDFSPPSYILRVFRVFWAMKRGP